MRREDSRNQVGSRSTRWTRGRYALSVRHSLEDPRTGLPVWVAEVYRIEQIEKTPAGEFLFSRKIAGSRHGNRRRAVQHGMRVFQRICATRKA